MTDHADAGRSEASFANEPERAVGAYHTDDGTVLYDAENPLAWIESSRAVRVDEAT